MNFVALFLQIYRNIVYAQNKLPDSRKVIPEKASPLIRLLQTISYSGPDEILKNKKGFYEAVEKYRDTFIQTVTIDELIFYRSVLKPEGPEYISLNLQKL